MPTWIVSAGADGRDYTEHFYRSGMAFVGGDTQRAAMAQVAAGDTILLKRGLTEFLAAGQVIQRDGRVGGDGDKEWLRDFDGWDLAAYRFVEWHVPPQPHPAVGLRMGTIYPTANGDHLAASAAFYQALEQCRVGVRVTSHERFHELLWPFTARQAPRELSEIPDVFLADFDARHAVHFSPLLAAGPQG